LRRGTVVLVVEGEPWRTVPDEVVVRCGLAAGIVLDRPLLRRLRRELRHAEALAVAGRTLRRRDLSTHRLAERLENAGVAPAAERSALEALTEARVLDDSRFATARASTLGERGWGDAAIAARLEAEGVPEAEAREALARLASETSRAQTLSEGLDRMKAWALLARRGFEQETIEAVVGSLDDDPDGGLG
jgi:SOS response regulatory protein OraA/RecX